MKKLLLVPMILGLTFGVSSAVEATPTCPPAINAADYTVDGTFDVDAYLAALAAALAACDGDIPKTGNSDSSQILTLALGLSSVGLILAVPTVRRRLASKQI
jgi:hypothetical protein